MMLFDTHSHIYFEPLGVHGETILSNMREHGIVYAVQIGCNPESNEKVINLAKQYPNLPAVIGIHPTDGQSYSIEQIEREIETLDNIISENRQYIVGIGETGLDYFRFTEESEKNAQKILFIKQVELAKKYNLSVVIHCRDAGDDMFELIKQTGLKKLVFHCYSEDTSFAKKILDYSDEAYFGFSGILTYKNAINIQDAAYSIPLGRILIETDSPFLSPQPVRGQVNEPSNVRFVFEKLCELRPEGKEEVEKQVYANSLRFYNMK